MSLRAQLPPLKCNVSIRYRDRPWRQLAPAYSGKSVSLPRLNAFSELSFPRKRNHHCPIGVRSDRLLLPLPRMCPSRHRLTRSPATASPADRLRGAFYRCEIVLCVLVEILGGNSVAARRRFACEGNVAFEYLVSAATDPDVGAVAVECLIVLRASWLLSKRTICVKATARPLIWS